MATQEEVILEILARTDQAVASVERLNKAFDDQAKKADETTKKAGNGFLEMAAKIGIAYQAMTKFLTAYEDQAKADARLNMAIKNNTDEYSRQGKTVNQLTDEYKKFASAQQDATGIGDEQTQQLQSLLVSMGTAPDQVNRVTAALQDMAAGAGVDATMLARAWSRMQDAPEEALTAFSRAGLKLKQEQLAGMTVEQQRIHVLTELEKKFKGQAAAIAQATGGLAQARAAFGDAMEVAGELLTKTLEPLIKIWNSMPAPLKGIAVAIGALTAVFKTFNGVLKANPFLAVASTILTVAGALSTLTDETEAYKASVDQVVSLNNQAAASFDRFAKQSAAVDALKNLTYGTDEYRKSVNNLLRESPDLVRMGITSMSSYDDVREAMYNLNKETIRRIELQKIDQMYTQRDILLRKAARFAATPEEYQNIKDINDKIRTAEWNGPAVQNAIENVARVAGRTMHTEVKDGIVQGAKDAKTDVGDEIGKAFTGDDFKKSEEEAAKKLEEDMASAMSAAIDIGSSILRKDWGTAVSSVFSLGGPFGAAMGQAFNAISDIFSENVQSSADMMKDAITQAQAIISSSQKGTTVLESIFGANSPEAIKNAARGYSSALTGIATKLNIDLASTSQEAILQAIGEYNSAVAAGEHANFATYLNKYGIKFFNDRIGKTGIMKGSVLIDSLTEIANLMQEIDNTQQALTLSPMKLAVEDIQHQLDTGVITQDEYTQQLVAQYDLMITELGMLEQTEEVKSTINKLEEERYALLKKTGEQLDSNLQTEKMAALLAEQSALERQIATGALRAGTYETVMKQQDVLQRILSTLRGQGASSATMATYEDQLAALMTQTLGAGGFAALSGTGAAVTLPSYATARSGSGSSVTTNNNTTASNTISLNANLPPDIINYIMREVQRSSGGRNILGGYN